MSTFKKFGIHILLGRNQDIWTDADVDICTSSIQCFFHKWETLNGAHFQPARHGNLNETRGSEESAELSGRLGILPAPIILEY